MAGGRAPTRRLNRGLESGEYLLREWYAPNLEWLRIALNELGARHLNCRAMSLYHSQPPADYGGFGEFNGFSFRHYLYLIMDVCSRKSVGWEVFAQASAEQAAAVFTAAHRRAGVPRQAWVLPADNDSPMKGATLLATRQRLGVVPAFSRPAVRNDNPYSEALFTTLKYQPDFPAQPFDGLARARRGVEGCVAWNNEHHRHRALKFLTPGQRHRREDQDLLAQRRRLYAAAKAQYPERWSGAIRNGEPDTVVLLNPGKPLKQEPQPTPTTA